MKWLRILGLLLTLAVCQGVQAQTATVTWTTTYQTMDGWGAEDWFGGSSGPRGSGGFTLTSSQAATFFSPTSGIGLEYIRTGNYACPTTGACAVSTANVPDLVTLQEASANGALITVHIQPPSNLKYNGEDFEVATAGANGTCIPNSNWGAFAAFTVSWIQMLQANGVPVHDIEVANEPDLSNTDTLGACIWNATGIDSYIAGNLGPALTANGLSAIKVSLPQNSLWFNTDLVSACLNDTGPTGCAQYVSAAIGHGYGLGGTDGTNTGYCCHTATPAPSSTSGKQIWMTEVNGGFTYQSTHSMWTWDPSIADALVWAHSIHDYLTVANASAWFYWELVDWCGGNTQFGCAGGPYNSGLAITSGTTGSTPNNLTLAKRAYAVGNWSKFVRPGWVRIGATTTPVTGVFVTAFNQTSNGGFAIVAINNSSNTAVTFSLSGFPTSPSSVTPWITSGSLNLAQQTNVAVSDGSFTYTLPAYSITSFVGNTAFANAPAPPTELTGRVQ
jgi:glucuronoarabinoxylan endo-1,4-beta-xylanase